MSGLVKMILSVITWVCLFCGGLLAQAQGNSDGRGTAGEFPVVAGKSSLTIAGKGYWHRQTFEDGAYPSLSAYDDSGQLLPDGVYRYEFRTLPDEAKSPRQQDLMRAARAGASVKVSRGRSEDKRSGRFEIQGGQLLFP